MKIIVDSGSTKADWRITDGKTIKQWSSRGLNPNHISIEVIKSVIQKFSETFSDVKIEEVYFYGAGCSDNDTSSTLYQCLKEHFNCSVYVFSDLTAAGKAGLGNEEGIAVILGTGANVGLYNNGVIEKTYSGYGYLFGDEGSGAYMGKLFFKDYLSGKLPNEVKENFENYSGLDTKQIYKKAYAEPEPNRFLAEQAKYIFKNKEHSYFNDLIIKNFEHFFDVSFIANQIPNHFPLSCVGSIAFYFEKYLRYVSDNKGYIISGVIEKPISALTLYHQNGH